MAIAPIDVVAKVKGLNDLQKLELRMKALEDEVTRLNKLLPQATSKVVKFNRSSKQAATGGIGSLTGAIGKLGVAVAGITTAFGAFQNTLKEASLKPELKS